MSELLAMPPFYTVPRIGPAWFHRMVALNFGLILGFAAVALS